MEFNASEAAKNRDWQEMMSNTAMERIVAGINAGATRYSADQHAGASRYGSAISAGSQVVRGLTNLIGLAGFGRW